MKQTAVEWLEKIRQGQKGQPFDDYEWEIAFSHAKEMEKEQIKDAYWSSYKEGQYSGDKTADEYYNETYKQQKDTDDIL
jgi:hypothetical protein